MLSLEVIQSPLLFVPLALLLALGMGWGQVKRTLLFTLISGGTAYLLKMLYGIGRVCGEGMECYTGLAFPSGHSALAFGVALSFYPTPLFVPLFIYAILVGIFRITVGAHSFSEVVAGYALALVVFLFMSRGKKFKGGENELLRQSSHIFMGLLFTALYALAKDLFLITAMAGSAVLLYYSAHIAGTVPLLRPIERVFERDAPFFGYGALHFLAGMMVMALYIFDSSWALGGMLILTLGDGLSTIVGKYLGRRPFLGKSVEGTLTFLAVAALISFFLRLPWYVAPLTTAVELLSKRLGVDDNLAICLSMVGLWWLSKLF